MHLTTTMAAATALLFFLIVAAASSSPSTALNADIDPVIPRLLNRPLTRLNRTAHVAVSNRTGVRGVVQQRFVLNRTCSVEPARWVGFKPALGELLARLRAGLLIGVDDGRWSYSENTTVDGNTIYGLVGCAQTLATSDCKTCIDAATDELSRECGGQTQGYVTNRSCFAMFKFSPSPLSWPLLGRGGEEGKKDTSRRVRMVLTWWSVLAICVAGFVLSVWFVQRSIVNRAKVGVLDDAIHDGKL